MRRLAVLVTEWPRAVVTAALVLAALGAWLGAFQLRIDSDTDSLIAPERPFMPDYRAFLAEFGDLEGAIIAVDPRGHDADARAAADFLAAMDKVAAGKAKATDYLVPATFAGNPSPRRTEHALTCPLVFLDIDDADEAKRVLAAGPANLLGDLSAVVYHTARSTPAAPRLRAGPSGRTITANGGFETTARCAEGTACFRFILDPAVTPLQEALEEGSAGRFGRRCAGRCRPAGWPSGRSWATAPQQP